MEEIKIDQHAFFSYDLPMGYDWTIVNENVETLPSWLSLKEEGVIEGIDIECEGEKVNPSGIVLDSEGNMFLSDRDKHRIIKVSQYASNFNDVSIFYTDENSLPFSFTTSMVFDTDGTMFIADSANHRILKLNSNGEYMDSMGNGYGFKDGNSSEAQFKNPSSLLILSTGKLIVIDTNNHRVRHVRKDFSEVTTLAGSSAGFKDGDSARFRYPTDMTRDESDNIFISDSDNNRIRKIDGNNIVTTFAGSIEGCKDAFGMSSQFHYPMGMSIDTNNNLVVTDSKNHSIRKITSNAEVSTLVIQTPEARLNMPFQIVHKDNFMIVLDKSRHTIKKITKRYKLRGIASTEGKFSIKLKNNVKKTKELNISVTQSDSFDVLKKISNLKKELKLTEKDLRNITPVLDDISTDNLAFYGQYIIRNREKFSQPSQQNEVQRMIFSVNSQEALKKISSTKEFFSYGYELNKSSKKCITLNYSVTEGMKLPLWLTLKEEVEVSSVIVKDTNESPIEFNSPYGIAIDNGGNIIISDRENHKIKKITSKNELITIAGSGEAGDKDGEVGQAKFRLPTGIAIDRKGNIIIADEQGHRIRKIISEKMVSTIIGNTGGDKDGEVDEAQLMFPNGVCIDRKGDIILVDMSCKIKKIISEKMLNTIVRSKNSTRGDADGEAGEAAFDSLSTVVIDNLGNMIVVDCKNHKVKKVTVEGRISTLAGSFNMARSSNAGDKDGEGSKAHFNNPYGVAIDNGGNIIVSDTDNHKIKKITPKNEVITIAGTGEEGDKDGEGSTAKLKSPMAIVIDNGGNIIISDLNKKIKKIVRSYKLVGTPPTAGTYPIPLTLNDGMEESHHVLKIIVTPKDT